MRRRIQTKKTPYGPVKVIEDWQGYGRLYVKRTNLKTWVVSIQQVLSLESMVEVGGEYHFASLAALEKALS